jgi:DNA (cytosine-5)-methyltransferase 1
MRAALRAAPSGVGSLIIVQLIGVSLDKLMTSNQGRDIAAVLTAYEREGYRGAARIIDAAHFVPQSRKRCFVVGVRAELGIDPAPLFDRAIASLPKRSMGLMDALDLESRFMEFEPDEVERCLAMTSPEQQAKADEARALSRRTGRPVVLPFQKRMRGPKDDRIQRVEFRDDGVVNALRVVASGGSSKEFLMIVDGGLTRMRVINPREAARLMGLPDSYILPSNPIDALSLVGDGVCVPVVRFLAERVIEPLLANAVVEAQGSSRTAVSALI